MVFHRSLRDNKSPQVSRTLLSVLADLSNAVVWMVSTRPVIFKFFSLLPIFWWLYREHQLQLVWPSLSNSTVFLNSIVRSRYLSFFSLFFQFYLVVSRDIKVHNSSFSFFVPYYYLFVWLWLRDPLVSQNSRRSCVSHSPGQILGCAYTICPYGQIKIFCTVPSLPTPSCLVLYFFLC